MKNKKYIIIGALVILLAVLSYFVFSYDLFAKKIVCTSSTDVAEPGDPIETKINAIIKKDKVKYMNVKYTYVTKDDAKGHCSNYKDDKKKTHCSGKNVTVYKTDDFQSLEGSNIIGMSSDDYKGTMELYGYKCN